MDIVYKKNLEGNGPKECRISILLNNSVNMRQYMIYTNEYSMNTDTTCAIHILYAYIYEQIYILHVCSIILTFPQPLFFSTWCLSGLIWVVCLIIDFAFFPSFACGATSFLKWPGMQRKFFIGGKTNRSFGKECPNSFSLSLSSIWPKAPCSNEIL